MNKRIAVAGNMLVDTIYSIERYPKLGELTTIDDNIMKATGGAVCNNIVNLAKLDPTLQLTALGVIGNDQNGKFIEETLNLYKNIDLSLIEHEGITSFTAVMSEKVSKERTFFQFRGSNAKFSERHIDWEKLNNVKILHIGYILLLDELDEVDEIYGTKMARLLANAQQRGIETSIDVVSDAGNRFKKVVPPALKYTDYCIINELEAEQTVGIKLRDENGIIEENILPVLKLIKKLGVAKWAVIHSPEGGYGLDCETGEFVKQESLHLPNGFIMGTTGAGDAFCSGVLYGAYKDKPLLESIELGISCAACSLSKVGASDGVRSMEETVDLYKKMRDL